MIEGILAAVRRALKCVRHEVGAAALLGLASTAAGAAPALVADIGTIDIGGKPDSQVQRIVAAGDVAYFVAEDVAHGKELWKTDGSAAGTALVKDIQPGSLGSDPDAITVVDGVAYFTARDGAHGLELWRSDGTAAGTRLVKDIFPGPDGYVFYPTAMRGAVYFMANDGANGVELWKSDGTAAGTQMVKDINPAAYTPSTGSSGPQGFVVAGDRLYFRANDGTNGNELWVSDGTAGGTMLLKDIRPGSAASDPFGMAALGDRVLFRADDGTTGSELWVSDGTMAGTTPVKDINSGAASSFPGSMVNLGGTLYFSAETVTHGRELWKTDGTPAGTQLVLDIPGGSGSPTGLTVVGDTIYYSAADSSGFELWKSDGSAAGTLRVAEIWVGADASSPSQFVAIGDQVFFVAADAAGGRELWVTDGTAAGTALVADIWTGTAQSSPASLVAFGNLLLFSATDATETTGLWRSDGTAAGTSRVTRIDQTYASSVPSSITDVGGTAMFVANDGVNGSELWKSDGTGAGTTLVKDVYPGSQNGNLALLTNVNGTLFFRGSEGVSGAELWKSDGTAAGTAMVKDIHTDTGATVELDSNMSQIVPIGATAYFPINDGSLGTELWKSDGTAAGTVLVKDIRVGNLTSFASRLANVDGTLYFSALDGGAASTGRELWKSNGTAAGTVLVKDIYAGSAHSDPAWLTNVSGTLFFTAENGSGMQQGLWKSDGTAAGTVLVKEAWPATGSYSSGEPQLLTAVGTTLFFTAMDAATGRELWKSDGTAAGTVMVKDLYAGAGWSDPQDLVNLNGTLYFTAVDGASGRALWKSDGTAAGTVRVADTCAGTCNDAADHLLALTDVGLIVFSAYDDANGYELWISDGTAAGTRLAGDVNAGSGSSRPLYLTRSGDRVYFHAYEPTYGHELYAVTVADLATPPDTEPDAFAFTDVTGVEPGGVVASNPITVAGIDVAVAISVENGTYSIGCATYTADDGEVTAGDEVCVRHTAAGAHEAATSTTLYVAGVSDTFTSTTRAADVVPDAFAFTPQAGVARGSLRTSDAITVSGIDSGAAISVADGEYSVNEGAWTAAAGTVANGDDVRVRHTASAAYATAAGTVLTIGGVAATFTSTTEVEPPAPAPEGGGGGGGSLGALDALLGLLLALGGLGRRRRVARG